MEADDDLLYNLRGLADVMRREDESVGWDKWGREAEISMDAITEIQRLRDIIHRARWVTPVEHDDRLRPLYDILDEVDQ